MIYEFADLRLDTGRRQLRRGEETIKLTKLSFKVLEALVEAAPNLLTQDELIEKVWGPARVISPENLAQRVTMLRQSLGDQPQNPVYIETVFGQGFRLIPDVTVPGSPSDSGQSAAAPKKPANIARIALAPIILAIAGWAGYTLFSSPAGDSATTDAPAGEQVAIAVLPFVNISQLQEDEYFTDGMHHEILNRLAQISALNVTSRTTVMRYRDSEKSLAEIARELSVPTILEGGVQRVGDQVRINVQLVDTRADEHLWAQIYDREFAADQLFDMQSDISRAVARALRAELSPESLARLDEVPTESTEAYDYYLQAVRQRSICCGPSTFEATKSLLERAVALDPNFLRAQVMLLEAYGRMLWIGADPDRVYGGKALEVVTDIRRRWPDHVLGYLALGHYYYSVERDYERALTEYQAFGKIYPNDLEVARAQTASLKRLNRNEEHLPSARHLVSLDPGDPLNANDLLIALSRHGLVEQVLALLETAAIKFPDDAEWRRDIAYYRLYHLGDVDGYLAYGDRLREEGRWGQSDMVLTWLLYDRRDVDVALEHVAARAKGEYNWTAMRAEIDRAKILRIEGRDQEAQAAADRALEFVNAWIDAKRPFPDINDRWWYTIATHAAAVAGDMEAVSKYRAKAEAATVLEIGMEKFKVLLHAQTDAIIGDAEGGWDRIASQLGILNPATTAEYLAVHPYYQYLFNEVPAYREYIARARIAE